MTTSWLRRTLPKLTTTGKAILLVVLGVLTIAVAIQFFTRHWKLALVLAGAGGGLLGLGYELCLIDTIRPSEEGKS